MTNYCVYMTCRLYVETDNREELADIVNATPTEDFIEWEIDHITKCD
jgi:hypothetical protein